MPTSYPYPLGVSLVDGGVNVAVYSETATAVWFCTFAEDTADDSPDGGDPVETRTWLTERTGYVFHGFVGEVGAGARYGLRVDGPWDPANGLRHDVEKLLLDPHARAVEGSFDWGQALFSHDFGSETARNDEDSAAAMPKCVVTDDSFDWEGDRRPHVPLAETIVYEVHVKGFTKQHPGVPQELRGTYAGLANAAAIKHLTDLGVTSVELLPIHQFVQDDTLKDKGLSNYWGYNTIGFFAPHNEYSASGQRGQQVAEFKGMVKALHRAGLEVILDVVYNHTAEGNHEGPTLSLKGIDNEAYYRLVEGDRGHYFDTTGTGNSLNVGHPAALRLVMDSLRYWVTEMHVDGFRFDLATTLTRQDGDAEKHSAFLDLCHQDPVLNSVKLIAEPWDTAGYQVGGFPAEWSEWNGKFRDDTREYWGEGDVLGTFSQRVMGSPDVYQGDRRSPLASINFVTAHDGFTLRDLVSYASKHNEANGEDGRDGSDDNNSFNGGVEGPTDDEGVLSWRARQQRNLLATVLLSAGVPMLLGGDEIGRTQGGNNNAYCQDNEISWFDWDSVDEGLLSFTRSLITIRRESPALRPQWFRTDPVVSGLRWVEVLRADGNEFADADWQNPENRAVMFIVGMKGADTFALLTNSASNGVEFTVREAPGSAWELALSSDPSQTVTEPVSTLIVRDASFTLLRSRAS
ncbi:glycogen debranching protein GlgX [Frondihabitans australicus]|uniref:Glycogen operon protein n=1 Tax=Frondihabitans australicus TaxID=386892 RepID=A0A495IKB8_9MICO|nr:glycogen debranching protein GlgX [Frondihabitans australicus]RKR76403.1 glycogen operon protein [Frondihabitans australicus]